MAISSFSIQLQLILDVENTLLLLLNQFIFTKNFFDFNFYSKIDRGKKNSQTFQLIKEYHLISNL